MKPARRNCSFRPIIFPGLFVLAALFALPAAASPPQKNSEEELLVLPGEIGRSDGRLVVALRAEPKTLNPLIARVQVVPLEFRSLLDRVTQTKAYDAGILGIASFDRDPNSDSNVWLSSGGTHLWNPSQARPATPWEAEIDRLIDEQMYARTSEQRKQLYDRAQEPLGVPAHDFSGQPGYSNGGEEVGRQLPPSRVGTLCTLERGAAVSQKMTR